MDIRINQLLAAYQLGKITEEELYARLPPDIPITKEYVWTEISAALDQPDQDTLDRALRLLWIYDDHKQLLDLLHRLLLAPHHYQHQYITHLLQTIRSPTSVSVIRAALETNFNYLTYTGSKRRVIAQWFSWALHDIGTSEAIQTMQEFAETGKKGIRKEMRYRLSTIAL